MGRYFIASIERRERRIFFFIICAAGLANGKAEVDYFFAAAGEDLIGGR